MNLQYVRTATEGKERYKAIITNLNLFDENEIELVKAKHFHGYGKHHVTDVFISSSTIWVMPDVGNHYINLSDLSIDNCGLMRISKTDFFQLNGLTALSLKNNVIKSLSSDLFELTPQLTQLSLYGNKITFISKHTLTPLTRLKYADFRKNININELYDLSAISAPYGISLCELRTKIFRQCKPPNEQLSTVASYINSLWGGLLSDFTIKAKEQVFKVHKAVLAANSAVFTAMFSHEMEENVKNEMTIENFSPESVKELLAFVYLREVPHNCFNATDLYALAHEYQINELSEQIQWHISMKVNRKNTTEMLKFGVLYNNEIIKQAAFQAIEESLNRKLPESLLESVESLMELLDVKDKLDEVLNRIDQIELRRRFCSVNTTMEK